MMTASASPALFTPRKATRKAVRLRIAINGPSGSGKTLGGLALAFSLVGDAGKVCVIDTEHNSAELYADKFPAYDVIPLEPPYTSLRYEQALAAASQYGVVIIDQISHEWDGEGGILDRKAELDKRPGSNSYTNWQSFTPEHRRFIESILASPAHVICTMRAKQDYVLQQNDKGKAQPIKVGLAPVQRDGTEYEFSLVFDVQMDHKASASKDRTGLFDGKLVDLCSPKIGESLRGWLSTAEPIAEPQSFGFCVDCTAPVTSPLVAEHSKHAFNTLVCLACGTKRAEQAGAAAPTPTVAPPQAAADVAAPTLRGTPSSTPVTGSTAAGVAPTTHEAPVAVAAAEMISDPTTGTGIVTVQRLNIDVSQDKNGKEFLQFTILSKNGRYANKLCLSLFPWKQKGFYDEVKNSAITDRLTFRVHKPNGSKYTEVEALIAVNGQAWPPEEPLLITDKDVPF